MSQPEISAEEMRSLFKKSIELQRGIIADAEQHIERYEWALAEMDKENNIIEAEGVET